MMSKINTVTLCLLAAAGAGFNAWAETTDLPNLATRLNVEDYSSEAKPDAALLLPKAGIAQLQQQMNALRQQNQQLQLSYEQLLETNNQMRAEAERQQSRQLDAEALQQARDEAVSDAAALREQLTRSAADYKQALAALTEDVELLRGKAAAADDKLAAVTSAQEAEREQAEQRVREAENALAALRKEEEARTAAEAASRALTSAVDKSSYSLGAFYYEKMNSEFNKIKRSSVELNPSVIMAGVMDAYRDSLKIQKKEIAKNVAKIDSIVQVNNDREFRKIVKAAGKSPYEVMPNGSVLVTEKATQQRYAASDDVVFNMLEKTQQGKPILNTMNTRIPLNKIHDPLMKKVIASGGKGGQVSLYGRAAVLYKVIPEGVPDDSIVKITFQLN